METLRKNFKTGWVLAADERYRFRYATPHADGAQTVEATMVTAKELMTR